MRLVFVPALTHSLCNACGLNVTKNQLRWSNAEVESLYRGVKEHGEDWALILTSYSFDNKKQSKDLKHEWLQIKPVIEAAESVLTAFDKHKHIEPEGKKVLSTEQLSTLESYFRVEQNPNPLVQLVLASGLNLDTKRVRVWFQNRRAKLRRDGGALKIPRVRPGKAKPSERTLRNHRSTASPCCISSDILEEDEGEEVVLHPVEKIQVPQELKRSFRYARGSAPAEKQAKRFCQLDLSMSDSESIEQEPEASFSVHSESSDDDVKLESDESENGENGENDESKEKEKAAPMSDYEQARLDRIKENKQAMSDIYQESKRESRELRDSHMHVWRKRGHINTALGRKVYKTCAVCGARKHELGNETVALFAGNQ